MKQLSFSDAEYEGKRKQTRREVFLTEMDRAVPWDELERLVEPHYPKAGNGRRPYRLATMLRPLPSAVVRAERPGDGGGTLRDRLDAAVCRSVAGAGFGAG